MCVSLRHVITVVWYRIRTPFGHSIAFCLFILWPAHCNDIGGANVSHCYKLQ